MINESVLSDTRIVTLPSRVAEAVVRNGPFVIKPVPLQIPPFNYFAFWHPRFTSEPRLRWILNEVTSLLTGDRSGQPA